MEDPQVERDSELEEEEEEEQAKAEVEQSRSAHVGELVAKLALTLAVSAARALTAARPEAVFDRAARNSSLMPSVLREHAAVALEEGVDLAGLAGDILQATARLVQEGMLQKPEVQMTSEAFAAVLQLATQILGPVKGLSAGEVFSCTKAYMVMQGYVRPAGQQRRSLRQVLRNKLAPAHVPSERLRHYSRLALAAYGSLALSHLGMLPTSIHQIWNNTRALEYMAGTTTNGTLLAVRWRAKWVGSIYKPGYFVLMDQANKEIVIAVRGSYRFQDSLTDLMCEDTPFDFHYDKGQDLRNAQHELGQVLTGLKGAIAGISESAEDMTLGELESSVRETTRDVLMGFKGFLARQGELLGEEMRQALEDLDLSDSSDDESDDDPDGSKALARRRLARDPEVAAAAAEASAKRRASRRAAASAKKRDVPAGHRVVAGRAHFGFLKASKTLAEEIEPFVTQVLEANPGYKPVIVGHSLGAAVAALITLMWSERPHLKDVRCYGLAPPASVSLDIAQSSIAVSKITNVILHDDVVPRLSLGAVTDLRNSIVHIANESMPDDPEGRTVRQFVREAVKSGVPDETMAERFAPIMARIRETEHTSSKLYPPGTLWHIEARDGCIETARKKQPSDFGELVLSPSMFSAHLPNAYGTAMFSTLPVPHAPHPSHHRRNRRNRRSRTRDAAST